MIRLLASILGVLLSLAAPAWAAEFQRIGYGHLMTNDFAGDGRDRWRSGSMSTSLVFGPEWTGSLPGRPGKLLEFRLLAETLAPTNLTRPVPGDRPFAGHVALGVHTHFQTLGYEVSMGGELSVIGPQTGLDHFQSSLHDILGIAGPSAATRAGQIGNRTRGNVVLEMGREIDLSSQVRLRPFVEARAGVETLVRGGVDVTIGSFGQGGLSVRDAVTGHRYGVIDGAGSGLSFVLGADIAHVSQSVFLPKSRGLTLTDDRSRVRAGMRWQGGKSAVFYGVTWMGREFTGQSDDQVVGSLRLKIKF